MYQNFSSEYYQENKERLKKKEKLVEYREKYYRMRKNAVL